VKLFLKPVTNWRNQCFPVNNRNAKTSTNKINWGHLLTDPFRASYTCAGYLLHVHPHVHAWISRGVACQGESHLSLVACLGAFVRARAGSTCFASRVTCAYSVLLAACSERDPSARVVVGFVYMYVRVHVHVHSWMHAWGRAVATARDDPCGAVLATKYAGIGPRKREGSWSCTPRCESLDTTCVWFVRAQLLASCALRARGCVSLFTCCVFAWFYVLRSCVFSSAHNALKCLRAPCYMYEAR
jgi:hypothetical protein